MEEILLREPPRARDRARDGGRSTDTPFDFADPLPATTRSASAHSFHVVAQGSPLWAWVDASPRQSAPSETAAVPTPGIGHRIVAAFRAWRPRDRLWDDLHRLSDHMLKDIGLRREDLGHRFIQPRRYID
jgi:uncharacterized protein YjiS (DUF1127 family)